MRALILACLALVACGGSSPSSPSNPSALRLSASISQGVLQPGEIATLTFRLENAGATTVTLQFPSACQITYYIATASGTRVYPGSAGWMCAQVLSTLALSPGESKAEQMRVGSRLEQLSSVYSLPPGDYVAYARIDGSTILQSAPVAFTVR